jgi:preprotein translocase subunit SecD
MGAILALARPGLLDAAPSHGAPAQEATAHFVLCAPDQIPVTDAEMNADLAVVQGRLVSGFGIADAQVARADGRCLDVDLPASGDQQSVITAISKTGALALADSDDQYLTPGTKVRLKCKQLGCAPHTKVGKTNVHATPPVLQVVVPQQYVQQGSAQVGYDSDGNPTVTYNLVGDGADAWCNYTSSHIQGFAAIVVDNRILSDPQIEEGVCDSQTQITGLASASDAQKIAAYLNDGPLAVPLQVVTLT